MKNTLKLLLCTMCCTMVFNNCGYSMQGTNRNFNNNQSLNQMKQNEKNEYKKVKDEITNSIKNTKQRAGLQNIGSTCYMNAVLQCIANNPTISSTLCSYYFMTCKNKNNDFNTYIRINDTTTPLTKAYTEILINLYNNTNKFVAPYNFKNVLGQLNDLFKNFEAADAKDFILFLLERLHQETNSPKLKYVSNFQANQYNKDAMFKSFFYEYFGENGSAFTDEYYGFNYNETKCHSCKTSIFTFQTFNFIIFPLLDVSTRKGNHNPKYDAISIEDCFNYNQKTDLFKGDNQMHCNRCGKLSDASQQTKIYSAPKTLILILNRGRNNQDYYGDCKISEDLDIKNYVEEGNSKYYLSGAVVHIGESGPSGHFIAYCRSGKNEQWYQYNDAKVSPSNFNEVKGKPYILFYTQC